MDIQQQKFYKILLIGETCVDQYIYGTCGRLSPEAAVPVLDIEQIEEKEGMSGNVKKNLEGLGCEVYHITNDLEIRKTRVIDTRFNHHIVRIDSQEKIDALSLEYLKSIENDIASKDFDAVVISDYNKGFLQYELVEKIIGFVRDIFKDIPVFVDTKKIKCDCFNSVILKINYDESINIISKPRNSETIVTLGKRGAKWKGEYFPGYESDVYDVCGAGDTFLSGLAYMYLYSGKNMKKSIDFANKCASIAVRKNGVYAISYEEVLENSGVSFEK